MIDHLAPVDSINPFLRPHGSSERSWYSYKLRTLWIESASYISDIATHELSHFMLHAFTPYGAFLDEIRRAQNNQVLRICIGAAREFKLKVPFPIYVYSKSLYSRSPQVKSPSLHKDFSEFIKFYTKPWSHATFLENLLEGKNIPSVLQARETDAIRSLENCENYLGQMTIENSGNKKIITPSYPVKPIDSDNSGSACLLAAWRTGTANRPLGGAHIFEAQAQLRERNHDESTLYRIIFGESGDQYLSLWIRTLLEFFGYSEEALQTASSEDYLIALHTFWALCDLALFTPIGEFYKHLRTANTSWLDIQPGWRFVRALEIVKRVGWLKRWPDEWSAFQRAICNELNWVAPEEFLRVGSEIDEIEFYPHRDACLLRLQHPCFYLDDNLETEIQDYFRSHMPIMFLSWRDQLFLPSSNAEETAGALIGYFLPQFSWQIMMGKDLDYRKMIPQHIEFKKVFSNIENQDDWINFILAQVPALASINFEKIDQYTPS